MARIKYEQYKRWKSAKTIKEEEIMDSDKRVEAAMFAFNKALEFRNQGDSMEDVRNNADKIYIWILDKSKGGK